MGWSAQGSKNPNAQIDEHDVLLIRQLSRDGMSNKDIAEKFSLSPGNVWLIVTYQTWVHVR